MKKLMIAAAGAGKTTYLINRAHDVVGGKVLITTFTIENHNEIKKKLIKKYGFIPPHIEVKTWFDFLLKISFSKKAHSTLRKELNVARGKPSAECPLYSYLAVKT